MTSSECHETHLTFIPTLVTGSSKCDADLLELFL
jgi:hypothetical protein